MDLPSNEISHASGFSGVTTGFLHPQQHMCMTTFRRIETYATPSSNTSGRRSTNWWQMKLTLVTSFIFVGQGITGNLVINRMLFPEVGIEPHELLPFDHGKSCIQRIEIGDLDVS